jgi:hypothetical protein
VASRPFGGASSVGGAAEREKGEREGRPAAGVPRGTGRHRGAWPRPVGGAQQRPEHGARGRRAPRALPARNREGAGANRWAVAQCWVAVPLTGGSSLSAGACGPAREGAEVG